MIWVVQRIVDGRYYSGFRREPWVKFVSAAIAFASKVEAAHEIQACGWRGVRYLPLPRVRRSPNPFAKLRPS